MFGIDIPRKHLEQPIVGVQLDVFFLKVCLDVCIGGTKGVDVGHIGCWPWELDMSTYTIRLYLGCVFCGWVGGWEERDVHVQGVFVRRGVLHIW